MLKKHNVCLLKANEIGAILHHNNYKYHNTQRLFGRQNVNKNNDSKILFWQSSHTNETLHTTKWCELNLVVFIPFTNHYNKIATKITTLITVPYNRQV